ncbi:hypothetical protein CA13_01260 [Planctomycetes bacterium CA13]|uniref:Uncharacterized protein n=1 Tax=Novipirellula herctigrandis TaxID=2527986 RepID=A0A5C5YUL9_9BACT|nr:hypothetical protein CA13_01260 [Planctomycetes bacterium CA13]
MLNVQEFGKLDPKRNVPMAMASPISPTQRKANFEHEYFQLNGGFPQPIFVFQLTAARSTTARTYRIGAGVDWSG